MRRLYLATLAGSFMGMATALGEPVEYRSATRLIEVSSIVDSADDAPATPFEPFDATIMVDGEFWGPVATAMQRSVLEPWKVNVLVEGTGDTESGGFGDGNPGTGSSTFQASFRVSEPIGYRLNGFVSGYDGVGQLNLSGVFWSSATTVRPNPKDKWDTTPGVNRFDVSGVLPPGDYTLSASGYATPSLGGWGGGEAHASLEFIPLTLADWMTLHAIAPGTDLSTDDDNDGKSLLTEATFHLDPTQFDAAGATPQVEFDHGDDTVTMSYPLERSDLEYIIEWTTDFETWNTATGVERSADRLTTMASFPIPDGSSLFGIRLRVNALP